MRGRDAVTVGVLVLLAGCGPGAAPERRAGDPAPAVSSQVRPLPSALVGQWKVGGPGIAPDVAVNLADRTLEMFGKWCVLYGTWDAHPGGPFLADLGLAGSGRCFEPGAGETTTRTAVSPFRTATSFVVDRDRRLLLDATGAQVAALEPASPTAPPAPSADSTPEPPQAPAAALDTERPPMPTGFRPADPEDVVGVWSVSGPDQAKAPTVRFGPDRSYEGATFCHSRSGRWDVAEGALLMTGPVSGSLMPCEHDDPFVDARAVGTDGVHLLLVAADGELIQQLDRVQTSDQVGKAAPLSASPCGLRRSRHLQPVCPPCPTAWNSSSPTPMS